MKTGATTELQGCWLRQKCKNAEEEITFRAPNVSCLLYSCLFQTQLLKSN